jgi:hypothetical protein
MDYRSPETQQCRAMTTKLEKTEAESDGFSPSFSNEHDGMLASLAACNMIHASWHLVSQVLAHAGLALARRSPAGTCRPKCVPIFSHLRPASAISEPFGASEIHLLPYLDHQCNRSCAVREHRHGAEAHHHLERGESTRGPSGMNQR